MKQRKWKETKKGKSDMREKTNKNSLPQKQKEEKTPYIIIAKSSRKVSAEEYPMSL